MEETKEVMQEEIKEEEKVPSEPPTALDIIVHGFDTLYQQNHVLHTSLNTKLEEKFEKLEKRFNDLESSIAELFLQYTRSIMSGIDECQNEINQREWTKWIAH